jgi:hypothetical protein
MSQGAAFTLADVEAAAHAVGCEVSIKTAGPSFRIELIWQGGKALPAPVVQTLGSNDEPAPPPELLGYCNGFTQPTGAAHLETIEVRKFTGFWSRRTERGRKRYDATRRMQPGVLLGAAVCCWILERDPFGCKHAQLLCIRDDERQHRPLVRYYAQLGFHPLREVGPDLRGVADRIVWGGEGTLMEACLEDVVRRWSSTISLMAAHK